MERYLSTIPISPRHQYLDPKLGSKSKLWLYPGQNVGLYTGVDVRDAQYVTSTTGFIFYHDWSYSLEIGVRVLMYENQSFKNYDQNFDVNPWRDSPNFIFIGGVLYF
tara:strand:- start:37 stop:357 length:321 start_codon:yes stop_codon:yes gene_type:complete